MAQPIDRQSVWNRLTEGTLDILVIGGGIVGSGVVRDAAMRGLRVGLLEQHDFAGGTSSRSSRLLHGGLRYLEQGRIGLVREASLEKKTIHRIAPHLAEPLGFVFPTYRGEGRPLWQLRIGVKLYDLLCSGRNFEPSCSLSQQKTLDLLPLLRADKLAGAVYYFDALTNDARLVIDTLRSAAGHDALLANYARFHDSCKRDSMWHCQVEDCESGTKHEIRARAIVNATGPLADKVPHSGVRLRLSKGIHIAIDRSRLPVPSAVVITEGKRILFVIPWGERVIIGTTDTDYRGRPEDVIAEPEDVVYVLRTVNEFFPGAEIHEADIVSRWAGLRPLIANSDGSPSDISRAHQIRSPEPMWWDIAGGKLTTYRLMAEQAVDQIVKQLRLTAQPCRTSIEPILSVAQENAFSGIKPAPFSRAAVEHFVVEEWALHLDDVIVRRSGWYYYDRMPKETIELVADWMSELANWSQERKQAEVSAMLNRHPSTGTVAVSALTSKQDQERNPQP